MAFGAETALESKWQPIAEDRQLLINFESGNTCGFTEVCRENCVLNARRVPAGSEMSEADKRAALRELIVYGETIRHVALVGKEPLANIDLICDYALPLYHSTTPARRPGSFGLITSGLGLRKVIPRFRDRPLPWMILSVDTIETGLRNPGLAWQHFNDAVQLRDSGGVTQLGVNSLLTDNNCDALLTLGQRLLEFEIDQWSISPMVRPVGQEMRSILSPAEVNSFLFDLAERFSSQKMEVMLDADYETFAEVVCDDEGFGDAARWRIEKNFRGSDIVIAALNTKDGFFARCRWDAQISAKSEFTRVGLAKGKYGSYSPGRFRELLSQLSALRDRQLEPVI
jgi:hypothetical protein